MSSTDQEEKELHGALQYAVGRICASDTTSNLTRGGVQSVASLAYLYATTSLANDLVHFARHAKRQTISSDDVLLIARKDPGALQEKLREFSRLHQLGLKTGTTPIQTKATPLPRETAEDRAERVAILMKSIESSDEDEESREEMEFQAEDERATAVPPTPSNKPYQLGVVGSDFDQSGDCELKDSSSEEEGAPKQKRRRRRLEKLSNGTPTQQHATIGRKQTNSRVVALGNSSSSDDSLDAMLPVRA